MSETETDKDEYLVPLKTTWIKSVAYLVVACVILQVWTQSRISLAGLPRASYISFTQFGVCIIALTAALGAVPACMLASRRRPIALLRPDGLAIHTPAIDIDLLRWDEIEEIRAYGRFNRAVGIIPKDIDSASRRMRPFLRLLFRLNVMQMNLSKRRGHFDAPIIIPQMFMPITADELIDHIRDFQLRYDPACPFAGDDPSADPAAWPPDLGAKE